MSYDTIFCPHYQDEAIELQDLAAIEAPVLLEFGTDWCGHCQRVQPMLEHTLSTIQDAVHMKVADGKGKRLGRHFRVKLWPTLVVLRQGIEVARVTRPENERALREVLQHLS